MSNPLLALRRLLQEESANGTGQVTSVGASITVSMSGGMRTVTSITPVSVGDYVLIVDGVIRGKVQSPAELPVYYL